MNIKNNELEYVDKDIYSISFSGESFNDSVFNLNSLKIKGEAHNHYFFTTGVSTNLKNNEAYDPIYTLQSNLLSVYSKPSSMIFNEPLILDDIQFDMKDLDINFDMEFSNDVEPNPSIDNSYAICELEGNSLVINKTGRTGFILIRWISKNDPIIIQRYDESINFDSSFSKNTIIKDGDLIILSMNGKLQKINDKNIIELLRAIGKDHKGRRTSPNIISKVLQDALKKYRSNENCSLVVISAWVSYKV